MYSQSKLLLLSPKFNTWTDWLLVLCDLMYFISQTQSKWFWWLLWIKRFMNVEQYTLSRKGTDTKTLVKYMLSSFSLFFWVGFLRLMADRLECIMGQCTVVSFSWVHGNMLSNHWPKTALSSIQRRNCKMLKKSFGLTGWREGDERCTMFVFKKIFCPEKWFCLLSKH